MPGETGKMGGRGIAIKELKNMGSNNIPKRQEQEEGFTIVEIAATVVILGIAMALAATIPRIVLFDPLNEAYSQTKAIIRQVRARAIQTNKVATLRLFEPPGPDDMEDHWRWVMEIDEGRNCREATALTGTFLTQNVTASWTRLPVESTQGFMPGDRIVIGWSDPDPSNPPPQSNLNEVIGISTTANELILGRPVGRLWENGTLVQRWNFDPGLQRWETLLPKGLDVKIFNHNYSFSSYWWQFCADPRGILYIYHSRPGQPNFEAANNTVIIRLTNKAGERREIRVLRGGVME